MAFGENALRDEFSLKRILLSGKKVAAVMVKVMIRDLKNKNL